MITPHPSVQHNCKHIHICYRADTKREDKRHANRRYRRYLNARVKKMESDLESWYEEDFAAPSFSNWDID